METLNPVVSTDSRISGAQSTTSQGTDLIPIGQYGACPEHFLAT